MSNRDYDLTQLGLPQAVHYQCDLMIWRSAPGPGAIGHPGHASLLVRRQRKVGPWRWIRNPNPDATGVYKPGILRPAYDPAIIRYVSFWPYAGKKSAKGKVALFSKGGAMFRSDHIDDCFQELGDHAMDLLEAGAAPRAGQLVIGKYQDLSDIWGQWPQVIIPIQGLNGARADQLGLNLNEIVAWTIRFRYSAEFTYIFVSNQQNCAGVAVRAMAAGGGDAFAELGGFHAKGSIYMIPNDAQRWGEAVARGVARCNQMLADLRNRTADMPPVGYELMSVAQWKSASALALTMRGRMTRAIDDALKTFHAHRWIDGFQPKFEALVSMIKNTHEHLQTDSQRNRAYLHLANQIKALVGWLARQGDRPWDPQEYYGHQALAG